MQSDIKKKQMALLASMKLPHTGNFGTYPAQGIKVASGSSNFFPTAPGPCNGMMNQLIWDSIIKHLPYMDQLRISQVSRSLYDRVCRTQTICKLLMKRYYSEDPGQQSAWRAHASKFFSHDPHPAICSGQGHPAAYRTNSYPHLDHFLFQALDEKSAKWVQQDPLRKAALCRHLSNKSIGYLGYERIQTIKTGMVGQRVDNILCQNGMLIVYYSLKHKFVALDMKQDPEGRPLVRDHGDPITCLITLGENMVVTGDCFGAIKVWLIFRREEIPTEVSHENSSEQTPPPSAALHSRRHVDIKCIYEGTIRGNNNALAKKVKALQDIGNNCFAALLNQDNRVFILCAEPSIERNAAVCIQTLFDAQTDRVASIRYHEPSRRLFVMDIKKRIQVWDVNPDSPLQYSLIETLNASEETGFTFEVISTETFVTASKDNTGISLHFWELAASSRPYTIQCAHHMGIVEDIYIKILPNSYVLTHNYPDMRIRIWKPGENGSWSQASFLNFQPNSSRIVGSPKIAAITCLPDGRISVTSECGSVHVFDNFLSGNASCPIKGDFSERGGGMNLTVMKTLCTGEVIAAGWSPLLSFLNLDYPFATLPEHVTGLDIRSELQAGQSKEPTFNTCESFISHASNKTEHVNVQGNTGALLDKQHSPEDDENVSFIAPESSSSAEDSPCTSPISFRSDDSRRKQASHSISAPQACQAIQLRIHKRSFSLRALQQIISNPPFADNLPHCKQTKVTVTRRPRRSTLG